MPNILRYFRFSTRTLLVVVTIVAAVLASSASTISRLQQNRLHFRAIFYDGKASISDIEVAAPAWLHDFLSQDYYLKPGEVCLTKPFHTDTVLAELIPHMNEFDNFHALNLHSSNITDEGLRSLVNLRFLDVLWLGSAQFSDAGLEHLAHLPHLKTLHIRITGITSSGVNKLQLALPECDVRTDFAVVRQTSARATADQRQYIPAFPAN